jgi:hypothetical protein
MNLALPHLPLTLSIPLALQMLSASRRQRVYEGFLPSAHHGRHFLSPRWR